MTRAIIGLILYWIICVVIWYVVWVWDLGEDREALEIAYQWLVDYCKMLEDDNKRFMEFVPPTERKKEMIINMKNLGVTEKDIAELVWVDQSCICRALQRWNKHKKSTDKSDKASV